MSHVGLKTPGVANIESVFTNKFKMSNIKQKTRFAFPPLGCLNHQQNFKLFLIAITVSLILFCI